MKDNPAGTQFLPSPCVQVLFNMRENILVFSHDI